MMASLKILRVVLFAFCSSDARNHLKMPRTESVSEAETSRPASAPVFTSMEARAIAFFSPAPSLIFAKSTNALNVSLYPLTSNAIVLYSLRK